MILRPRLDDYKIIGYYLGKITISIGIVMMVPFIIAIGLGKSLVISLRRVPKPPAKTIQGIDESAMCNYCFSVGKSFSSTS